jgi:hypothetical protein
MPVTTRSQTRSPPTTRAQHTYSLRENRHPQGYYADMQGHEDENVYMAADALMTLSSASSVPRSWPSTLSPQEVRRSSRIASLA